MSRSYDKANPYPDRIPNEVWNSHRNFFADRNKDNAQVNWKAYLEVLSSYKQEGNKNFLKDDKGEFIKVSPKEMEVANG